MCFFSGYLAFFIGFFLLTCVPISKYFYHKNVFLSYHTPDTPMLHCLRVLWISDFAKIVTLQLVHNCTWLASQHYRLYNTGNPLEGSRSCQSFSSLSCTVPCDDNKLSWFLFNCGNSQCLFIFN